MSAIPAVREQKKQAATTVAPLINERGEHVRRSAAPPRPVKVPYGGAKVAETLRDPVGVDKAGIRARLLSGTWPA
jgi:hypothetical protein